MEPALPLLTALLLAPVTVKAIESTSDLGKLAPANLVPNGSFEHWDRFGERALEYKQRHLWNPDPPVPVRWVVNVMQPSSLQRSSDGHGGGSAAALVAHKHGLPVSLEMLHIEVMPKATYSFGIWLKGQGQARLVVSGIAVEGRQKIAETDAVAGENWTQVESSFTAPRHIRSVCLTLSVSVESDLLVDDAYIAAPLAEPYDADSVLAKKYGQDEHTLLFEDFDGVSPSFLASGKGVAVTDDRGGRFGRGLRLNREGSATIPHDPLTMVGAAVLMIAVAALAAWLPARRAARIDPMKALRYE
jgi:hypothetical protein